MEQEIWKKLDFNIRYEISNYGRLRSNYGKNGVTYLKGVLNSNGRQYFSMVDKGRGYLGRRLYSASRLVAEYFVGKMPFEGAVVDHLDNDPTNNYYENLEWVSQSENIKRSYSRDNRKIYKGEEHWLTGTKASRKTRGKMSEAKKGVKHPKFTGYYVCYGKKYGSTEEPSRIFGVSRRTIDRWCKGGKKAEFSFEGIK